MKGRVATLTNVFDGGRAWSFAYDHDLPHLAYRTVSPPHRLPITIEMHG